MNETKKRLHTLTFVKPVQVMVMCTPEEAKNPSKVLSDLMETDWTFEELTQLLHPRAEVKIERYYKCFTLPVGYTMGAAPWLGENETTTVGAQLETDLKEDRRDDLRAKIALLQAQLDAV